MADELKLLEGYLSDIRGDIRGLRNDIHNIASKGSEVDAQQGLLISNLQARMVNVEKEIVLGQNDRSKIWDYIWKVGISGALVAQIVMGNQWESVVK